jgi:hypothetical protein
MGDVYDQCPRCSDDLKWGAISCKCGWKKRKRGEERGLPPRVPVQCAHDACSVDATIRVKTAIGWANLCYGHYLTHWQRGADAYCARAGLNTLEQKRWFCQNGMAAIGALTPERWMETITQRAVDIIARSGLDTLALDRMRARGIIDRENRVIPPQERMPDAAPRKEALA